MKLLIIRHAKARDKKKFAESGSPDSHRPLTKSGRKEMRKAAKGLKRLVDSVRLLGTSPFRRAVETAKIVHRSFPAAKWVELEALTPGSSSPDLLRWLRPYRAKECVALVGHEPHLSRFTSWLLSGQETPFINLKKGAAILLEFEDDVKQGKARLLWMMTPSQLSKMRK